ncbi:cellulose biosynthesis protein BcsD [Stenotrophomonas sp. NPDC077659]|uniref:cellulose biosynthesis protein BcsD n=1 Tax=Stenotrophomonas sp. NPDC077659 TaxID=3390694 RepID=UPI003D013A53
MSASELLDHYRLQACSLQWRGFILAMAAEFAEALPDADVARLMARIGERFARDHRLPVVDTLAELESAANAVWASLSWGVVTLREGSTEVRVEHLAAPLTALLAHHAGWNTSFLEGVYRVWFREAGMLPSLDLEPGQGSSADVSRYILRRVS